jgi:TrmH family RNA methyltransferase
MKAPITSLSNPTVKNLVKLRQHRERAKQGMLLIDGARALLMALRNDFSVSAVYFSQAVADKQADLLRNVQDAGGHLQPVTPMVFRKIGYGEHPDGLLGVASCPYVALADLPITSKPLYLVAEGLEKPGNLGAMMRSADAAGATALVLCDGRTDLWNPNVIRASQGACFSVPVAVATTKDVLLWLRRGAVQIIAATPLVPRSYCEIDLRLPSALVLGAEHDGLTSAWRGETRVCIPMAGQLDSLNVAQTASILLFEAVRQRVNSDPDRLAP